LLEEDCARTAVEQNAPGNITAATERKETRRNERNIMRRTCLQV
jgi:hypothetical protein